MTGRRGQGLMEFAILFGVVIAALTIMNSYLKRSVQQSIKTAADRMSPMANDTHGDLAQLEGMRLETGDRPNRTARTPGPRKQEQAVANSSQRKVAVFSNADGSLTRKTPKLLNGELQNWQKSSGALSKYGDNVSGYSEVVVNQ